VSRVIGQFHSQSLTFRVLLVAELICRKALIR